jgi:putative two-component system response regulator
VAVIEGDPAVRRFLKGILEPAGFRAIGSADSANGLRSIHEHQPELALVAVEGPRIDGPALCRVLRSDPRTELLPVLGMAAADDRRGTVDMLDAGADDVMGAPIHERELLARLRTAHRRRRIVHRMEQAHAIVVALSNAVEAKDAGLKDHCRHLAYRSARLGAYVGLRGAELEGVAYGALLHDIGKIATPEHVLHKAGPLTADELIAMRAHPEIGARICDPLRVARDIAPIIRHHHERWDGRGYPDGLRGERIPIGARIVALADAYDAIVRGRPYRPARSHEEAIEELRRCSGSQFDPALVPLFIDEAERFDSGIPPSAALPAAALLERGVSIVPSLPVVVPVG